MLSECLRGDKAFALRERLLGQPAIDLDDSVAAYDLQGRKTRGDQYLYFAASVFWRAAAHSWHYQGRPVPRISLGPRYQEEFRQYLLGQGVFPINGRIFVHVWQGSSSASASVLPCTERIKGVIRHKFCIPGVLFILFLGSDARTRYDLCALNGSNGSHMWVCPFEDDSLFRGFGRLIKQAAFAKPSGRRGRAV